MAHADPEAAHQVHGDDEQRGDDVPFDELHRAVHRAEELALLREALAALFRSSRVEGACTELGVDGHLFARQPIEHEARAHLRHALGPGRDHDELHDGEQQKQHCTHDEVGPRHQLAVGVDHSPCVGLHQNKARRGEFEGEPHQRAQHDPGRKRGHAQGAVDLQGHQEQHQRHGQVGGQKPH